jgi:hypothetical protein
MAEINVNLVAPSSAANDNMKSRRQPFTVGLVVAVPAAQGGVAGVGKWELQRRRFNVTVAKCHVGFANHQVNFIRRKFLKDKTAYSWPPC